MNKKIMIAVLVVAVAIAMYVYTRPRIHYKLVDWHTRTVHYRATAGFNHKVEDLAKMSDESQKDTTSGPYTFGREVRGNQMEIYVSRKGKKIKRVVFDFAAQKILNI